MLHRRRVYKDLQGVFETGAILAHDFGDSTSFTYIKNIYIYVWIQDPQLATALKLLGRLSESMLKCEGVPLVGAASDYTDTIRAFCSCFGPCYTSPN